ncbi:hypothetical protein ColTof4_05094 [Colletotrichum tofieldiae]|nr:hypothetical protein ColTof4_05094 [Colletotrichum tofieldiae]
MEITQNIHLQPILSVREPPMTGPTMGPRIVPTDQTDTALPLSSRGIRSAIVPEPMVIVATPAKPDRKREKRSMLSPRDRAHNTVAARNSVFVAL